MSRILRAMAVLLLLAACGGRNEAPRNLDNACSIVTQHRDYLRAFQATERKWGVPVAVQMAVIYQESKFIANARPPHQYALGVIPLGRQSSAYGYAQALDSTWEDYQKREGGQGARRNNIRDAADFMGWYMAKSSEMLGISTSDVRSQYLAYHEGRTGYKNRTYNEKGWLLRIASEVEDRAMIYAAQLSACRAR